MDCFTIAEAIVILGDDKRRVEDTIGSVVQFKYGEDGIDPTRSDDGQTVDVDYASLNCNFNDFFQCHIDDVWIRSIKIYCLGLCTIVLNLLIC